MLNDIREKINRNIKIQENNKKKQLLAESANTKSNNTNKEKIRKGDIEMLNRNYLFSEDTETEDPTLETQLQDETDYDDSYEMDTDSDLENDTQLDDETDYDDDYDTDYESDLDADNNLTKEVDYDDDAEVEDIDDEIEDVETEEDVESLEGVEKAMASESYFEQYLRENADDATVPSADDVSDIDAGLEEDEVDNEINEVKEESADFDLDECGNYEPIDEDDEDPLGDVGDEFTDDIDGTAEDLGDSTETDADEDIPEEMTVDDGDSVSECMYILENAEDGTVPSADDVSDVEVGADLEGDEIGTEIQYAETEPTDYSCEPESVSESAYNSIWDEDVDVNVDPDADVDINVGGCDDDECDGVEEKDDGSYVATEDDSEEDEGDDDLQEGFYEF